MRTENNHPPVIQAILADIEQDVPLRTCNEISGQFEQALKLLAEAVTDEHYTLLEWEHHVCSLRVRTSIINSADTDERFTGIVILEDGRMLPDPNGLNEQAHQYIAERAKQVENQVMKARYADYVWEKSALSGKYQYALMAIDAYLTIAPQFAALPNPLRQVEAVRCFDHAVALALMLKNKVKIVEAVASIEKLLGGIETGSVTHNEVQAWPDVLTIDLAKIILYVREKDASFIQDEILMLIQDLTERIATERAKAGNYLVEQQFLKVSEHAAELRKEDTTAFELRLRIGKSLEQEAQEDARMDRRHLAAAAGFQQAQAYYARLRDDSLTPPERRLELDERERAMRQKIREMYQLGRSEVKEVRAPIEVDLNEVEEMFKDLLAAASLNECLEHIASEGSLLPNVSLALEMAQKSQDSGLLIAHMPKVLLADDMNVLEVTTDEERIQFEIDRNLLLWVNINSHVILVELFNRLRKRKRLNEENLLSYFDQWGLLDEDNRELIRVGFERYFADDFVSMLHILVPQFEDVLRTLFKKAGIATIRPRTDVKGWQLETFGSFLASNIVKDTFPIELREYIRVVMTAQTGWNLRNRVAHGLIHPELCTKPVADTVLHLFLVLTLFRITNDTPISEEVA